MTIKRHTISYAYSYDVVVDIDDTVCTDALLHEINNFWSNADRRLDDAGGDITKAVLTMLALTALRMTITDLDPMGELRSKGVEGWPLLDGSSGITLVSLDHFELEEDEITMKSAVL